MECSEKKNYHNRKWIMSYRNNEIIQKKDKNRNEWSKVREINRGKKKMRIK